MEVIYLKDTYVHYEKCTTCNCDTEKILVKREVFPKWTLYQHQCNNLSLYVSSTDVDFACNVI